MSAPSPSRAAIAAYGRCEAITRRRAGNFYYGIRLLPRDKRRAICAVYAFARRVDDIGDGDLEPARKLALLSDEERALSQLGGNVPADPVMTALADASERFELPLGALRDLIEGVRMDVGGASYERFEDLVLYCRRVAGAIGRGHTQPQQAARHVFQITGEVFAAHAGQEDLLKILGADELARRLAAHVQRIECPDAVRLRWVADVHSKPGGKPSRLHLFGQQPQLDHQ